MVDISLLTYIYIYIWFVNQLIVGGHHLAETIVRPNLALPSVSLPVPEGRQMTEMMRADYYDTVAYEYRKAATYILYTSGND